MRIVATPLTSGNVTPGKEQPGTRTWRWRGKPVGWPHDPATHDQSPRDAVRDNVIARRQDERNERIRRYVQARCGGLDKFQAAKAVGVSWNNAGREYESVWKDIAAARTAEGHDWQPAPDDPAGEAGDGMRCYRCGITEAEAAELEEAAANG